MEKGGGLVLADAPSFVDICTLHQHAMRYYRLWIYCCNTVLALATLIFTLFALSIFVDPRISLLSGIEFYQPTFLYAYVALVLQCGILQAIGCVGAIRLNQKLLNIYWTLLLVLMIGDILVGLVWAFRLDWIKTNLRPNLKQRLTSQYGNDSKFTHTWDWVQTNDMCCGVDGPTDFLRFNDSSSNHFDSNGLPFEASMVYHPKLPSTCCSFTISQHFPTTPPPYSSGSSLPKGHPDWVDSSSKTFNSYRTNNQSTSSSQQRSNRITVPHYPNNNFTMHLSSFASSGGRTHDRRKILHSSRKHLDSRHPDPNQQHQHRSNVQTTTESTRRTPYGVCMLPSELLAKYKNNIYIKVSDTIIDNYSFEGSGSGSGSYSSEEVTPFPETISSSSTTTTSNTKTTTTTTTTTSSSVLKSVWSSSSQPSMVSPSLKDSESQEQRTTPSTLHIPGEMTSTTPPPYILVAMTLNAEGCGDKILEWVDQASDVLFVLGFCIIVFLKGCFVAILRYEIKEMIQKIKLLNGEDNGRMAAMNELIGLTSMYENVNNDPGEREGLMASTSGASTQGGDNTTNTNIDALESDTRKDSVVSRDHHNCIVGNNVANRKASTVGNHVGSNNTSAATPPLSNTTTTTGVAAAVHNPGGGGGGCGGHIVTLGNRHDHVDIEEDFDSGTALLGKRFFRNENGGRTLPRNGNNNTTGLGGVTGSASAPIPIEYMAK